MAWTETSERWTSSHLATCADASSEGPADDAARRLAARGRTVTLLRVPTRPTPTSARSQRRHGSRRVSRRGPEMRCPTARLRRQPYRVRGETRRQTSLATVSHVCGGSCVPDDPNVWPELLYLHAARRRSTYRVRRRDLRVSRDAPYVACGGACVDEAPTTTTAAVAAPRTPCPSGATNASGRCQCPASQLACSLVCATCFNAQNATPICNGTTCGYACESGLTDCAGGCWNTASDSTHCGSSCSACGPGGTCQNGACVCATSGEASCASGCVNESTDNNNCGSCGHVCPVLTSPNTGASCTSGECVGELGGSQEGSGTAPELNVDMVYAIAFTLEQPATLRSFETCFGLAVRSSSRWGSYGSNGDVPSTLLVQSSAVVATERT